MHLLGSQALVHVRFLRWSQTWSPLTMTRTSFPQSSPWGPGTWEMWEEWLPGKSEAKNWVPQRSPCHCPPVLCMGGEASTFFPLSSFSDQSTCRSPSCYSSHPLPNAAPAVPHVSWSHPIRPGSVLMSLPGHASLAPLHALPSWAFWRGGHGITQNVWGWNHTECLGLESHRMFGPGITQNVWSWSPAFLASQKATLILSALITADCSASIFLHTPRWSADAGPSTPRHEQRFLPSLGRKILGFRYNLGPFSLSSFS